MFQRVNQIFLRHVIQRTGASNQIEAAQILTHARALFAERFGEGVALHANPKFIKHRSLIIEIAHPAVGEEIKRQEEMIIYEINKRLGRPEITALSFIIRGR